ncbi:MAG: hypothetical protein AAFV53_34855 [Myxococcota bacterium]
MQPTKTTDADGTINLDEGWVRFGGLQIPLTAPERRLVGVLLNGDTISAESTDLAETVFPTALNRLREILPSLKPAAGGGYALVQGGLEGGFVPETFIGRQRELDRIGAMMNQGGRLATLIGAPGMGRSALLRAAVDRYGGQFSGGVIDVDLDLVGGSDGMLEAMCWAAGVRADAGLDAIVSSLASRGATLIAINGFERLGMMGSATVGQLLSAAPTVSLWLTNDDRLGLAGEQVFVLRPLMTPTRAASLTDVVAKPAGALLVERARRVLPDLADTPDVAAAMVSIARSAGGSPMGLRLLAGRLADLSPQDLRTTLQGALHPIDQILHRLWDALLLEHQNALRSFAVFEGRFDQEDAEGMVSGAPVHDLVDRGWLDVVSTRMGWGLSMPMMIRQFVRAQGISAAAVEHHQRWCLQMDDAVFQHGSRIDILRRLTRPPELRAAMQHTRDPTQMDALRRSLATILVQTGPLSRAADALGPPRTPPQLRIAAEIALHRGQVEAVEGLLAQLDMRAQTPEDALMRAKFAWRRGDPVDTITGAEQAGMRLRPDASPAQHAAVWLYRARGSALERDQDGEEDALLQGMMALDTAPAAALRADFHRALASLRRRQCQYREALDHYALSIAADEELGRWREAAAGHLNRSLTLCDLGDYQQGAHEAERGAQIGARLGDARLAAYGIGYRANALWPIGQISTARRLARDAHHRLEEITSDAERSWLQVIFGMLEAEEGRLRTALEYFQRASVAARETRLRSIEGQSWIGRGRAHAAVSDYTSARGAFDAGVRILEHAGDLPNIAWGRHERLRALLRVMPDRARDDLHWLRQTVPDFGDRLDAYEAIIQGR